MNKKSADSPSRSSWLGGWATLRDLEIIQAVIESGGVTAAAERLNITQPAVSRVLNQIERRSGRTLFWRENNRLTPTVDALILYREIKNIADSFSKLNNFHVPKREEKTLRIGVPPTIAYAFINKATAEFMQQTASVYVQLIIMRSEHIVAALENDELDIAIADTVAANVNDNIRITPFRKVHYACAMPKDHPLTKYDTIEVQQLNGVNFITLANTNIGRGAFDRVLRKNSSSPTFVAEVPDIQTALTFVNAGVGVSMAAHFFPYNHFDNVVFRPFKPDILSQLVFFTKQNTDGLLVPSYIDFIRKHQPEEDSFSIPI